MRDERLSDAVLKILDLSVSAFPDLRPWQFKDACLSPPDPDEGLYFRYLSRILDPEEGYDRARGDPELLKVTFDSFSNDVLFSLLTFTKEYCQLSLRRQLAGKRFPVDNRVTKFELIASRKSSVHKLYRRDLVFLMELCISHELPDLFLELGMCPSACSLLAYW